MPETRFWAEMSWTDFEARDMARTIAVLPVAATEQHGPHLPLGTDTFIMEGYLARVVQRLPDDLPVLFLPVQNCGLSIEHGFSRHAQPSGANPHQCLDNTLRMHLSRGLPQAGAFEFAWGQFRNPRHRRA
jgi:Creatinine amidohydrolase